MNEGAMLDSNGDDGMVVYSTSDDLNNGTHRDDGMFDMVDAAKVMTSMNHSRMNDGTNINMDIIDGSDDDLNKTFDDYSLDIDRADIHSVVYTLSKSINIIPSKNTKLVNGISDGITCQKMLKTRAKPSDKPKETKR